MKKLQEILMLFACGGEVSDLQEMYDYEEICELRARCDRYRKALERIKNLKSSFAKSIASEALDENSQGEDK